MIFVDDTVYTYTKFIFSILDLLFNVYYNGTVTCTPTAIIKVACETDVANFPFDEKHCKLIFGRLDS